MKLCRFEPIEAAAKNPGSIMTGLFIQSLNEVIDLHAKRLLVGLRSRIPVAIWVALFALALLGMASMGYQAGLSATFRSWTARRRTSTYSRSNLAVSDLCGSGKRLVRR